MRCISARAIWRLLMGIRAAHVSVFCVWSSLWAVEYRSGYRYGASLRSTRSHHQPSVPYSLAHFLLSSPLSHRISISKPEQAPYWQINITKTQAKRVAKHAIDTVYSTHTLTWMPVTSFSLCIQYSVVSRRLVSSPTHPHTPLSPVHT